MGDQHSLLKAIWEEPYDDLPRLVYADWLEQEGEIDRARFIRVQCLLSKTEPYCDLWFTLKIESEALWNNNRDNWTNGLHRVVRKAPFERGFPSPSLRIITAKQFMTLANEVLYAAPLWRFDFNDSINNVISAAMHRNMMRVSEFHYYPGDRDTVRIHDIFESLYLGNIDTIFINCALFGGSVIPRMCDNWKRLPRLNKIHLGHAGLQDKELVTLADSALLQQIFSLDLLCPDVTSFGISKLVTSQNIQSLSFFSPPFPATLTNSRVLRSPEIIERSNEIVDTICTSDQLRNLKHLELAPYGNLEPIQHLATLKPTFRLHKLELGVHLNSPMDIELLMSWEGLSSIRYLCLEQSTMTEQNARIIAGSRHLTNLKILEFMTYDRIEREEAENILLTRFGNIIKTRHD